MLNFMLKHCSRN